MEAQLRMKMQYDSRLINQEQKPYINVLPNYPYQAYKRFDQATLVNIKKTQRVPLPQIRQLILIYILQEKPRSFQPQSELLRQKISKNHLQQVNKNLNSMSQWVIKEEQRLNKLSEVFKQYQLYRQQLISRNVMRNMHNIHQQAEKFKNSVRMIQQQKNGKINNFMTSANRDRQRLQGNRAEGQIGNQQLNPREQQQLNSIQKDANTKILSYIRSQDELNAVYEATQQKRLRGLRFFGNYLNQFEKALIFIVSERHVSNINQPYAVANDNYYKTFGDRLNFYIRKVQASKEELLNYIFDWKMKVKFDSLYQSKDQQFILNNNELAKEMETELYYFIPNILMNIEKDREDLRNINDFFTKNYESYLGTYYSIKEVQLYHSKQSHIQNVIQNQRYSLNAHLKKNFGMMVPYKKSSQYEQLSSLAISREKPYLKSLMQEKISFLEQSIAYINYQHSNLYKEACSNTPGISNKIKRKLEEFQRLSTKCPQIKAHLEQSCQRLLEIINN